MISLIREMLRDRQGRIRLAKITAVCCLGLSFFAGSLWLSYRIAGSAPTVFNQTDWSGGQSDGPATQTGWSKYSATELTTLSNAGKDPNVDVSTTPGSITIGTTAGNLTDDTDANFNEGNLTAEWSMDEGSGITVSDNSGNGNAGEYRGSSLVFDGTTDYVNISNEANFAFDKLNAFSLVAWVKSSDVSDNRFIISKLGSGAGVGYGMFINGALANNPLYLYLVDAVGGNVTAQDSSGTNILDNKWHQVVTTYDGSGLASGAKLYIDGNPISSNNAGSFSSSMLNGSTVNIGRDTRNGGYFPGSIDEVRIYARELSAAEVSEHYQGIFSNNTNLRGLWHLKEGTGQTVADDSGNANNGTLGADATVAADDPAWQTDAPGVWLASGKFGKAMSFDGVDNYVAITNSASLNPASNITLSAWVKIDAYPGVLSEIIAKYAYASNQRSYLMDIDSVGKPRFYVSSDGVEDWGFTATSGTSTIPLAIWTHVAATSDGTTMKIYVNGVQDVTTKAAHNIFAGTSPLGIGAIAYVSSPAEFFLKGAIDEARVYNTALTPDQIKAVIANAKGKGNVAVSGTGAGAKIELIRRDILGSIWAQFTPTGGPPAARSDSSAVWDSTNQKMYIFGGYTGSYQNDLWSYTPTTNTWVQLTPTGGPPAARMYHSAVWDSTNQKMYIFGGSTGSVQNDLWAYTPSTNTWAQLTPTGGPPAARSDHSAVWDSTNQKMYIFGGSAGSYQNDLWAYTPSSNTWAQLTPTGGPPATRADHSAVWDSTNQKMYIFSGYAGSYLNDFWAYTPSTNTWAQLTPTGGPPAARMYHPAVWDSTNQKMYIFGGFTLSSQNDLWSYTPSSNTWAQLTPTGGPPAARSYHVAAWDSTNQKMYLFGGFAGGFVNDLWGFYYKYIPAGTYFSNPYDTNVYPTWGVISWVENKPANTTLAVFARASDSLDMASAAAWVQQTSGSAITGVTNGYRYIQYKSELATSDGISTPSLDSILINYTGYPRAGQELISSYFNSGLSTNGINQIRWVETVHPAQDDIEIQLQTAPDNAGSPGAWSSWLGPTSGSDYYTDPLGGEVINPIHHDGTNDQWFRYKVKLSALTSSSPIFSDFNIDVEATPAAPVPIAPSEAYVTKYPKPMFVWSVADGIVAQEYGLKIDALAEITGITDTSYRYTGADLANSAHTWKVRVKVDGVWSNYSAVTNFTVNTISTANDIVNLNTTLTLNGTQIRDDVSIISGGILNHGDNTTTKTNWLNLIVMGNLTISGTGKIDVSGLGYDGSSGTSPGGNSSNTCSYGGGGGAYGGNGGSGCHASNAGGTAYGSITAPNDLGSGGGTGYGQGVGGSGGGLVKLNVSGTLTNGGTIIANGADGTCGGSFGGGGGSGGTIYISAGALAGTGVITSNGGNGTCTGSGQGNTGGGGRIAIYYSGTPFAGTITAYGGASGFSSGTKGGAGTFYEKQSGQANANLTIKNAGTAGAETPLTAAIIGATNVTYNSLIVQNGAMINIASGVTITGLNSGSYTLGGTNSGTLNLNNIDTLTIDNSFTNNNVFSANNLLSLNINASKVFSVNSFSPATTNFPLVTTVNISGILTHNVNASTKTNYIDWSLVNLTIASGGKIDVSGKGYASGVYRSAGAGPGGGAGGTNYGDGGGGYGGKGGNGYDYVGGGSNGSITSPNDLGSGGGSGSIGYAGGYGGGLVRLNISGTLTNDGSIIANGVGGSTTGGGGGAGGGIYISTPSLGGTNPAAVISANGGAGYTGSCCNWHSGGGSGGRIAIYYNNKTYQGTIISPYGGANGGSGAQAGGAGTLYQKIVVFQANRNEGNGDLIVDNNNVAGVVTTIIDAANTFTNLTVQKNANLDIPSGKTVTTTNFTLANSGTFATVGSMTTSNLTVNGAFNLNTNLSVNPTRNIAFGAGASLTIPSGVTLTHDANTTAKTNYIDWGLNSVTINSGGIIDVSGKGFSGGAPNVAGNTCASCNGGGAGSGGSNISGGGAGYGAAGGNGAGGSLGGNTYGISSTPTNLGSGGGGGNVTGTTVGGAGGGLVKFNLTGTMINNGSIVASGSNGGAGGGSNTGGGAGSGGSVFLSTGTFTGNGSITAQGGAGGVGLVNSGGGGAGGRIAVSSTTYSFTGTSSVAGGTGNQAGGTGTLYGLVDHYTFTVISPQGAGSGFSATVTAKDSSNNTIPANFNVTLTTTGSAKFYTSLANANSDTGGLASLAYTLANGAVEIYVRDDVTQAITLTATDAQTKTGNSSPITINPGAVHHYTITTSPSQTAGVGWTETVSGYDIVNNLVTTDSSTVVTMGYAGGTNYRKLIPITGSSGAGAGYQIKILVGESSGTTGTNVNVDSHSIASSGIFDDVRFTDDDGATELSHWRESVTGTTPNRIATFWVKVNDNLDTNQNIYISYGNANATSASNGSNTFALFDDFESYTDGNLNGQGGWSGNTSFQVQASQTKSGAKAIKNNAITGLGTPHTISHAISPSLAKLKINYYCWTSDAIMILGKGRMDLYEGASRITASDLNWKVSHLISGGSWESRGSSITANTWYKLGIIVDSNSTHKLFVNDVEDTGITTSNNSNVVTGIDSISLGKELHYALDTYWDLITVSKYVSPEPAIGTPAAEQYGAGSAQFYTDNNYNVLKPNSQYTLSGGQAAIFVKDTKAETITLTAIEGARGVTSGSIVVNPNPTIASYTVSATSPQGAGVGWPETIAAKDAYGNTVTSDSSTVVTMSATPPANVAFYTASDYVTPTTTYTLSAGAKTIYIKDSVAETITLTATDPTPKTGTSASIVVTVPPTGLAPSEAYVTKYQNPMFVWDAPAGLTVEQYELFVDGASVATTADTYYRTSSLNLSNNPHTWKVRAKVSGVWGGFSQQINFSVNTGSTANDIIVSTAVTWDGTKVYDDVIINSGGSVAHTANTTTKQYWLDLITMGNITINSGGMIDVSGKGYSETNGPGASVNNGTTLAGASGGGLIKLNISGTLTNNGSIKANGNNGQGNSCCLYSGGAGYGGNGGRGNGSSYGNITFPNELGSGSGKANQSTGGGSGGTIYINTGTLAGTTGLISANGGNSGSVSYSGGGSGGRIAVYYSGTFPTGITTTAYGGTGYQAGGAGTIYEKNTSQTNGNLTIKNAGTNGAVTPLTSANMGGTEITYESFLVQNGAITDIPSGIIITANNSGVWTVSGMTIGGTLNLNNITGITNTGIITNNGSLNMTSAGFTGLTTGNITNNGIFNAPNVTSLTIDAGKTLSINTFSPATTNFPALATVTVNGTFTHNSNTTVKTNYIDLSLTDLTINSGGMIDADAKGFSGGASNGTNGNGPGGGVGFLSAGSGGGGYGGTGGDGSQSGNQSGASYGSITLPNDLGSGGGRGNGTSGTGGGLIKLNVSGTLTNNGLITANGSGATGSFSGGGSGGTVYLSVGTLAGTNAGAVISANGGNGYSGSGGGGAGGRIAVYYITKTYSGSLTASGATTGYQAGGAGTIYQKQVGSFLANRDEGNGDLIVDNNNVSGAATTIVDVANTFTNLTVQKNANFSVPSGKTVTTTNFTLADSGTFTTVGSMTTSNLTVNGVFNLNTNLSVNPARNVAYGAAASLVIPTGVTLTHDANTTAKTNYIEWSLGSVTLNGTGKIDVSEKGFGAVTGNVDGNGPGGGKRSVSGSGAGYGGVGGVGAPTSGAGGLVYSYDNVNCTIGNTSADNPNCLGSSGAGSGSGVGASGAGGGLVRLTLSGALTLNDTSSILANGGIGGQYNKGGGSGGTVYISTSSMVGSGSIFANGGNCSDANGGGGAGGRIAVHSTAYSFIGTSGVTGGTGYQAGGTGTLYGLVDHYNFTNITPNPPGAGAGFSVTVTAVDSSDNLIFGNFNVDLSTSGTAKLYTSLANANSETGGLASLQYTLSGGSVQVFVRSNIMETINLTAVGNSKTTVSNNITIDDTSAPMATISYNSGINVTQNSATITLTKTQADAQSGITDYDIEFKEGTLAAGSVDFTGAPWQEVGGTDGADGAVTSFTGTSGKGYMFRYRAKNGWGTWGSGTSEPGTANSYNEPTNWVAVDTVSPTVALNGLVLKGNTSGSNVYINGMADSDNQIAKAEITLQDNVTGNIQVQFSETGTPGTWGAYNGVSNVIDADDSWSVGEYKTITLTAVNTDQTLTAANVWKLSTPDGVKTLYARVKDGAGNVTTSSNDTITLDTTLPAVFDLSAPVSLTWTGLVQPSLSWGASSDALSGMNSTAPYKLYIDDTFNKDVTGTTTTPVSALSSGAHTWYVKAQDEAGNFRQSTSTRTLNVVDLTAPEGGATIWEEGSQHRKITWNGYAGATADTVKIEYSKDGGVTWAFCKDLSNVDYTNVALTDGLSGKTWNIPANFTDGGGVDWADCKVRITSNTLAGIEEISDTSFTVRRCRILSVNPPAVGNIWRMGGNYAVNWTTVGIPGGADIKLKYSVDNGNAGTWRNMAGELLTQAEGGPVGGTGIPTSAVNGIDSGTYSWTIPMGITGTNCKIKASFAISPKVWENTSAGFQIKSADLRINTPVGGARLIRGDAYGISWAVTGASSGNWNIKCIYLDTNYTQVIENIFTGPIAYSSQTGNDYNYSWTWNIPTNQYVSDLVNIEVSDSADSTISDDTYNNASQWMRILKAPTEDANLFAISQPLSTTSWYINSTKDINWVFAEPLVGPNMTIFYALGPGYDTWVPLDANAVCVEGTAPMGGVPVPASNSWAWGIAPGISVGTAKIKVYDNGRQTTAKISEAFNLIAPTVSITAPAADEELIAGTTYTISWDGTDGVGGNVNTDAGLKNKMTIKCVTQNDPEWQITAAAVHDPARLPNPGGSFTTWTVDDTVQDSAEDSIAMDTATLTITDNSRIATTNQRIFKIKEPSISFTSPLLDEEWIAGTQHNVSWTSSIGVGNKVSLYWSSVNSPSYTLINNNVDHDTVNKAGVFLLTVPDTNPGLPGDVSKLKIVDNTRAGTVFTRQFKIIQPVINILTPTLGETLRSGENYSITWNTTDGVSNSVKIEYYSPDVGIGWAVAAGGGAVLNVKGGTVNTFNWTVPVISTVQFGPNMAKVRITDNNRLATVSESNGFDIASPGINVGAPSSGIIWRLGSVQEINWVTVGVQGDNLQILYDKTGNFTGSEIDITLQGIFGVSPRRSFTWNIPLNESAYAANGTAKIKVKDNDAPYAEGISSAFSVARQVITLNEPAAPVSWILGTDNHSISWSMQGKINKVNIEYSPLGSWADTKVIQTNYVITDASGLYQNYSMNYLWTLPNDDTYLSNNTGKIRIRSTDPGLPVETSNISGVFSVVVPQFNNITVTAPSGETEFFVGDTASIGWTWTGSLKGNTKVSYSIDGTNWTVCAGADALVNTTAAYDWVIPAGAVSAGATRIKVEDTGVGRAATANISPLYTIKAQPVITITSPVSTPNWKVGTGYTISWTANEGIHANKVEVGYSTGDKLYTMIAGDQPVTGSVAWTVPAEALAINHSLSAGQVLVKDTVRALSAVLGDAGPVAAINVIANINLTQPLNLVVGDTYNISWTSSGTFTPLSLQLSADNGATWYDMGYATLGGYTAVVNSGGPDTYSWTVPNAVTAQALVRIYDPAYPAQVVVPSAPFNIGPEPNLTITAPTGVTSYRVGSAGNNISWTGSANSNDNIELAYSIDNGSTWPVIVSGKLKADTYAWTVPQAALASGAGSVIAKLRVRDMSRLATQMTHLPREVTILPPAISVNNLNNYLVITDTQGIIWSSVGGEDGATFTAAIKYNSPSSGWAFVTGGNSVASNANADTTFSWVIPNDLGISQIQVYDTYRSSTSVGLSNNFTICGKFDSVNVSSANLSIGGTAQISWTTTGAIPADQVELLYYVDGDFSGAQVIDAAVSAKTSPYTWTIPVDIAGSFINSDLRIRIRDKRVPLNSVSYKDSGICRIKGGFSAPSSPATGAEWNVGTAYNITWTTIGNISFVKLYYSANSSDVTPVWTIIDATPGWEITNNSNGQTTYSWMVPDSVTSDARIKVEDAGNAEAYAVSGQFKIKGGVDLIAPNGNENWIIGTSHDITWDTTLGTIANVKLEYSVNGGANWAPVAENEGTANDGIVANDGVFTWNIPDSYSETAKVRVSEASGASNIDSTAGYFVIASPVLTVIQPGTAQNGNASLSMLEPFDIKWSTQGATQNNLKIEVSYDNMATWITVEPSVPNVSPYTYSWSPASISNQAWIRITEIELNNYHPAAVAVSDGTFTIFAVPMINITGPATGEKWLMGKQYAINWNTQGLVFNNLRISYTLDSTAPIPVWTDIANNLPNSGSYIWTVPDLVSVLSDQTKAQIKIKDDTKGTIGTTGNFTIGIPTVIVNRPAGGEVFAVGETVPISWVNNGGIIGPLTIQYDASGTVTNASPTIATGVDKTGEVPGGYSYAWTVPSSAQTSTVKVRVKDSQRPNSRGESAANFSVIPAPLIEVSSPANGNVFVVEEQMPVNWTVRGLSVGNVNIEYWDDLNSNDMLDGGEIMRPIVTGISRGASDTSDEYSGKYTGAYVWTIPANTVSSAGLKLRVVDLVGGYVGYSSGHFRIRGGFEFRDEATPTQVLSSSVDWKAKTTHSIKWYNKGSFASVKLEYKAAASEGGLSSEPWTTISASENNAPNSGNISSYSWVVADPHQSLYPVVPPENYFVKLKISSVADPTISAESNAFKVSYYTVTWKLKDYDSMTSLNNSSVMATGGGINYWNVANDGLSFDTGVNYYTRRFPYSTVSSTWSKEGYISRSDSDRVVNANVEATILLESVISAQMQYKVYSAVAYNEDNQELKVSTWLEKKGTLINPSDVDLGAGGNSYIKVYDGETLIKTSISPGADSNGNFWFTVINATKPIAEGGIGLISGKTYFVKVGIYYRNRLYESGSSFDITISQKLKAVTDLIGETTKTIEIATNQIAAQSQFLKETIRADAEMMTETLTTRMGKVLTATETVLPTKMETERQAIISEVVQQVEPHVQSGILNRDTTVKQGEDVTIRYRTASGLSPKVDVYDPNNLQKVSQGVMKEVGNTGVYEYTVKFDSKWAKGDYTVMTSESTKGTLDAMVMTAQSTDLEDVASQVSSGGVSLSSGDIEGLTTSLTSQLDTISASINSLAASTGDALKSGANSNMEAMVSALKKAAKDIKDLGGIEGYNLDDLFEVSESQSKDLKYLANKTAELKKLLELVKQLMEKNSEDPIIQTWYESGSVIIRSLVVNPSKKTTRTVPFKQYLPKEVKSEDIMDKGDMELTYDTQQGMYFVHQEIELAPGESKKLSVEIEDIWVIDEKEAKSLREQAAKYYDVLKDTPYVQRADFLLKKVDNTLSEVMSRQGNAVMVNPEEHISVYRENVKDLESAKEDILEMERISRGTYHISPLATWWMIVIIVVFLAVLSIFFFLVWQKKLKKLNVSADEIIMKEKEKENPPGSGEDKNYPHLPPL